MLSAKSGSVAGRMAAAAARRQCIRCHSSSVKTGVLMLNMGGPRNQTEVQDFLTRLFLDRDIIRLPWQSKLGPWLAKRRTPAIIDKYNEIGGGSPILSWTEKQGQAMCQLLDQMSPCTAPHKAYVGFRYAAPITGDSLRQMEEDQVQQAVCFSQYPHYSCTTSGSSLSAVYEHYAQNKASPKMRLSVIDRWATHPLLVKTFADNIRATLNAAFPEDKRHKVVLLFSAHSVPQYVMDRGDSYPAEVAATVQLVMQELNFSHAFRLVWQSKVGPLPWLKPDTEGAIKALVKRGQRNLMLVPIAFVNEHIETLHEMDIEYAQQLGREVGAEKIARCPAPNDSPTFIQGLAEVVYRHLTHGPRISPQLLLRCPMCENPGCSKTKTWLKKMCSS